MLSSMMVIPASSAPGFRRGYLMLQQRIEFDEQNAPPRPRLHREGPLSSVADEGDRLDAATEVADEFDGQLKKRRIPRSYAGLQLGFKCFPTASCVVVTCVSLRKMPICFHEYSMRKLDFHQFATLVGQ